jgi:hypothetical protein
VRSHVEAERFERGRSTLAADGNGG